MKVTLSATVAAGDAYRVAAIRWAGSDLFGQDAFDKTVKLHPGDLASDSRLRESYTPLLNAYLHRGYVDVSVNPQPTQDAASHTVTYDLHVTSGQVYSVGSLTVIGLSPAERAQFDRAWTLPVSSTYDGVYALEFLPKHRDDPWLQRYVGAVMTTAHPDTRLVDVVYTFSPAGRE